MTPLETSFATAASTVAFIASGFIAVGLLSSLLPPPTRPEGAPAQAGTP